MTREELLNRISINPQVCFGKPCIKGRRIWVSLVLDFLASGMSIERIMEEYDLAREDVLACIATTVLLEAMLSFLGRGVKPPTPAWGMMIFESQSYFLNAPWLVFIPGAAILVVALAFNLAGDGLRDALDPTQRGRR